MANTAARAPGGGRIPRMQEGHDATYGAAILDGLARRMERAGCDTLAVLREGHDTRLLAVCDDPMVPLRSIDDADRDTRLDCLALDADEFDMLVRDVTGNDAKHILRTGTRIMGDMPEMSGETEPPRPIDITRDELDYNMGRYGFSLMSAEGVKVERTIRPEYAIVGAMFSRDPRRIFAGIPVALCGGGINYGLLTYLARRYMFEETLLGMLKTLQAAGRLADIADRQISMMESRGTPPYIRDENTILEALRVYDR